MALKRSLVVALILTASAPAFGQDAGPDAGPAVDAGVDGGPDPCGDACGPNLRCIELEGEYFCGQCAVDETQSCEECPESTQTCGGDLYWNPCDCGGCGDGPPCGAGLDCIDVGGSFFCGICSPGDTRNCDNGCGPGVETCESDLFWGRCQPTAPVECVPGDTQNCDSECGPGTMQCDSSTCEWTGQCVPIALIQCLPNTTSTCTVVGSCQGTMTCSGECTWSECVPDAPCHECGDGTVDRGEDCDDGNLIVGDGCSDNCTWEDARPFQSIHCGMGSGLPGTGHGAAALLVAAFVLIGWRRMR